MVGVEHFHLRLNYIARYWLVFYRRWVWLANFADITNRLHVQNPRLGGLITYVVLLWIPAVLYSMCVWLLLVVFSIAARRLLIHIDPGAVKTLKRRTAITASIVVAAAVSWFAVKLCRQ